MLLKPHGFAAQRINWQPKATNPTAELRRGAPGVR
jgi:predicted enzyme involved in methoxymalonyl-ACP biosynthesis